MYILLAIFLAALSVAGAICNVVFLRDSFYRMLLISSECVLVAKLLDTRLSVQERSKPAVILEITNEIFYRQWNECCCCTSQENMQF
jgi:hypothetical protein